MLKFIYGAIIAIILFLSGLITGRYYFAKEEIKVVEKKIFETKYKYKYLKTENKPTLNIDNFNRLLNCYNSDITFQNRTENNYLYVKAYDNCKQAEVKYKIGTKNNWTCYAIIGLGGIVAGATAILLLK